MYVYVHYPNHTVGRQSLLSTFILPKTQGVLFQAFPRALWQWLYSRSPCLPFDTTENKSTPKVSSSCHYTQRWGVFFFPSCSQNDLQLPQKAVFVTSHHQDWGTDEEKNRTWGSWRKLFDPTECLLIFTSQKPDIWDRAFMLRCSREWLCHTDEGRGDNRVETGGRGFTCDSIDTQGDSRHACCLCLWTWWQGSPCSHGSRAVEQRTMQSGRQNSIET